MIIEIGFLIFTILSGFIFKRCALFTPGYIKVFMLEKKSITWEFLNSYILLLHPYNSQGIQWVGENVILLAA